MKTIRCPYCGAQFEVPETVSVAVCPYCGTTLWIQTGELFKEHYIYPINYEYNRAYEAAIGIAARQFAAPDDLAENSSPRAGSIHWIPLYLYNIRITASCPGNPEAGLEERWYSVLATSKPPKGLTEEYRFPTRGRRFFEPRKVERGRYYQPDKDPKEPLQRLTSTVITRVLREAYNWCENPEVKDESKWEGIVHYPFWEVGYSYKGKGYCALVDAADGSPVYIEYPIGTMKRAALTGGALGVLLGGAGLGLALGHSLHAPITGLVGGLIASLGGAGTLLRSGVSRIGKYRLGGRVEIE
jgi:hypothetical protein